MEAIPDKVPVTHTPVAPLSLTLLGNEGAVSVCVTSGR